MTLKTISCNEKFLYNFSIKKTEEKHLRELLSPWEIAYSHSILKRYINCNVVVNITQAYAIRLLIKQYRKSHD